MRPAEQPARFADRSVVDAGMAFGDAAVRIEQPQLVAVAAEPVGAASDPSAVAVVIWL